VRRSLGVVRERSRRLRRREVGGALLDVELMFKNNAFAIIHACHEERLNHKEPHEKTTWNHRNCPFE
jgi:hypothetical protein